MKILEGPEQTGLNVWAPETGKRAVYIDIYLADKYLFIRKISGNIQRNML